MRLVPATLESWLLAGLLLLPAGVVIALAALDGDEGLVVAIATSGGALFYAAVVWLLSVRKRLGGQLAEPPPAPPGARLESLARTAGRAVLKAVALLLLGFVLAAIGFPVGLSIVGGIGLISAFTGGRLQRWEADHVGRLARVPGGPLVVL